MVILIVLGLACGLCIGLMFKIFALLAIQLMVFIVLLGCTLVGLLSSLEALADLLLWSCGAQSGYVAIVVLSFCFRSGLTAAVEEV